MDMLDEKQLDMKVFMEVLGMGNVMQMVIESLNHWDYFLCQKR